jgi:hypothetical protein
MEIRDYLRAIRRILWLVIALPIVAALITGFLIERQPSAYQANASVVVPAISGNGVSQSAASQYVSTFKDVLVSQPVLNEVSQKYGIKVSELASGLSASTVTASSNIIHIVLVGLHGQNLVGAVREATVDTMNAIAQPRLSEAQSEVSTSQTLLQNADSAIADWVSTTGNPAPQALYNSVQSSLNQQLSVLNEEKIRNDVAHEAATQSYIATLRQELETDGQQLQQYQALSNAKSAAISASDHAAQDLVDAQALIAADANPNTVNTVNVGRLSKLGDVIKFAGIGFALALIMMLGLVLILELMRSSRQSQAVADPEQGAFAWPAPAAQPRPTEPAASMASEPSVLSRDPWRASPGPGAMAATGLGSSGNGNGHANGNGHSNGNGHAAVRPDDPEQQQAARRLLRRR